MDASYGRDIFYEESSVAQDFRKGERKYKIAHICSIVFLVLGIFMLMICLFTAPLGNPNFEGLTPEESEQAQAMLGFNKFLAIFCGINGVFFIAVWFLLYKLKSRLNVSYDYCFVSGELRVSKVVNINKRKLIARFDCVEIIQIGDIDNSSYERLKSDPTTKEIVCTSNAEATEGKFFMYILINDNGKKLYLLECKEQLLINILKFANRSVLESDYVMQEKKQK